MKKMMMCLMLGCLLLVGCGSNQSKNDGEIHVYTRDASSGTREAFEKGVGFEGELTLNANEVSTNGDMAVKVGGDVNGIGYVSLSTDFESNNVKSLKYEGVAASTETVLDGSYALQRPFAFVTRASGDFESEEKEQLVQAFIDYLCNSIEAKEIIAVKGGEVDVENAVYWKELASKYPVLNQDNSSINIACVGSTSVEKTLKACLEDFQTRAGNVQFTLNQSGSSDGWKRVLGDEKDGANAGDIGFASRNFKDEENVTNAMLSGTYCIDAVVAIVSLDNHEYDNMTQEQLKNIFTGSVTNWSELK